MEILIRFRSPYILVVGVVFYLGIVISFIFLMIAFFEPQNAGGTLSMGILAILILVFGLLSYHYLGLHNRWISEGDSK